MRPISNVNCPSITLDEFIAERGIERVHAIKLDTQGSELQVLKGAEKALKGCIFLIVEVEFNALYECQPLFCDVDRFLRDRGFVLWRFNSLGHYSTGQIGGEPHSMLIGSDPGGLHSLAFPNGQLFAADALYVKEEATPINDKGMPFSEAVAGAALVVQWKFWDLAVEMIRKSGNNALVLEILDLLDSSFVEFEPRPLLRRRISLRGSAAAAFAPGDRFFRHGLLHYLWTLCPIAVGRTGGDFPCSRIRARWPGNLIDHPVRYCPRHADGGLSRTYGC